MEGLEKILSIMHNLIWIVIGIAIIIFFIYLISIGGPSGLIQRMIPSSQSFMQNSFQGNGQNQQYNQNNVPQLTDQEKQCAANVLGQARVNQILTSGGSPTSDELSKLQSCFPNGFPR